MENTEQDDNDDEKKTTGREKLKRNFLLPCVFVNIFTEMNSNIETKFTVVDDFSTLTFYNVRLFYVFN